MALAGHLEGPDGERMARDVATRLVSGTGDAKLDLRALTFADDGVARVIARAVAAATAQGRAVKIRAASSGTERFLRRHGIVPPADLEIDE
jgi:hypothetical protein